MTCTIEIIKGLFEELNLKINNICTRIDPTLDLFALCECVNDWD